MLARIRRYLRSIGGAIRGTPGDLEPAEIRDGETGPLPVAAGDETSEEAEYRRTIEELVGFSISDLGLYERALSHRSLLRRKKDSRQYSNERLEFLGDAVLGFVVADHLYLHFRNEDEGFLTRIRAKLVNGERLATAAREMNLGTVIRVSDNMIQKGGRDNTSVLADGFEAIIGALYLDLGIEAARDFIHRRLLDDSDMDHLAVHRDNYKSLLLEYVQAKGWPQPTYDMFAEDGPSHNRDFTVDVVVNNVAIGRGKANSKKKAEQRAAKEALAKMKKAEKGVTPDETNRVV